ncbi:MAG: sulfur transferase domain-containing protein [Celeribacter sp.]
MQNTVDIDSDHTVARFAPDADTLQDAARQGYRSIVNFKTDVEKQDVTPAEEKRLAEDAGLAYLHHPVAPEALDGELVDAFRRKLADLPRPVLLHCASGKRAGAMTLMAIGATRGLDGDETLELGKQQGLDLTDEQIGQFVKSYANGKAAT